MKKFVKGMSKDAGRVDQPNLTYRDALNAVLNSVKGAVVSEEGMSNTGFQTTEVYGSVVLENNDVIVLCNIISRNAFGSSVTFHAIASLDTSTGERQLLYGTQEDDLTGLNFSTEHPIEVEYKINSRGDTIIYFTDNLYYEADRNNGLEREVTYNNPPRAFNVSRQKRFIDAGGHHEILYGNSKFTVSKLNIFPQAEDVAIIKDAAVGTGGALITGAYHLAIAFADEDFVTTNYFEVSNPVYITPIEEKSVPFENIIGSPAGFATNKAITWTVQGFAGSGYEYIQPAVIQRVGGQILAYRLEPIPITFIGQSGELEVGYSGLENVPGLALNDVVIDTVSYLSAKTISQLDKRLYLGNLRSRPDLGMQKYVNSIKLDVEIESQGRFDPRVFTIYRLNAGITKLIQPLGTNSPESNQTGSILSTIATQQTNVNASSGYRETDFSFKKKSYRRGEVYAFYISFILHDGTESYAYHIPGRQAAVVSTSGGVKRENSTADDFSSSTMVNHIGFNMAEFGDDQPLFRFADTSLLVSGENTGYHENENERYPETDDFDLYSVDSSGNPINITTITPGGTLKGKKVRHHKMPSNKNTSYAFVGSGNQTQNSFFENHHGGDGDITLTPNVRILGVKLRNIRIPKHVLSKIQGYRVYYAKREEEDKTVLGQSIAHPGVPRLASYPSQDKEIARLGPYYKAYYMYGGPVTRHTWFPRIEADWTADAGNNPMDYIGYPVIKMHDFRMLRKRPSLAGATHIDCQFIVQSHRYSGGPRVFDKRGSGENGDTEFNIFPYSILPSLPHLGWITAGNQSFPNRRRQWEDEVGRYFEDPGDAGQNFDPDSLNYWNSYIPTWIGNVFIGAAYLPPSNTATNTSVWGEQRNTLFTSNAYTFAIESNSKTYLPGQSLYVVDDNSSFGGASYIYNEAGETSILLGLESGLPFLQGWAPVTRPAGNNQERYGVSERAQKWNFPDRYLNPSEQIVPEILGNGTFSEAFGETAGGRGFVAGLQMGKGTEQGMPLHWMVNICAAKTDVFQPFDQQNLVYTGYTKRIRNVILNSGTGRDEENRSSNYYDGSAESDIIFGGDTYISHYSCRTTSQSYGHCFFRANEAYKYKPDNPLNRVPKSAIVGHGGGGDDNQVSAGVDSSGVTDGSFADLRAVQRDIPINIDLTVQEFGFSGGTQVADGGTDELGRSFILNEVGDLSNWVEGQNFAISSIYYFLTESDDNLNFRHTESPAGGEEQSSTMFFDYNLAIATLWAPPTLDLTAQQNLLYNDDYSALQDLRVAVPYPKKVVTPDDFPTRIIRSTADTGSLVDKYREFLALDFKDLPKNRGEVEDIFVVNSILHLHAERSLFRTRGKEKLGLSDGSEAFVGSGDIFEQDPDEVITTIDGYGGTTSRFASITTRYGHFYVNQRDRKVYMVTQNIEELSAYGMEQWFRDNMRWELEFYDMVRDQVKNTDASIGTDKIMLDSPLKHFGFTAGYDSKYKRIMLTKHDLSPTKKFKTGHALGQVDGGIAWDGDKGVFLRYQDVGGGNLGGFIVKWDDSTYFTQSGWTLSYYPEYKIWGSRHSYLPTNYMSTAENMHVYTNDLGRIQRLDNFSKPGHFSGTTYPFEFEFIDNSAPNTSKIYSTFYYWADVTDSKDSKSQTNVYTSPGFTSFYVYNSRQVSGTSTVVNYLSNARLADKIWYINDFRDMSKVETSTDTQLLHDDVNVAGDFNTEIQTAPSTVSMFTYEGQVNSEYVDTNKDWFKRRKFIDQYIGIRLINDNTNEKLVHLYSAGTKYRNSNR
tara:strand:+ start:1469 stop:6787 length:5319 start_codon:yes stop_codon:yes gene_type:complete